MEIVLLLIIFLLLGGIGWGLWYFFNFKKTTEELTIELQNTLEAEAKNLYNEYKELEKEYIEYKVKTLEDFKNFVQKIQSSYQSSAYLQYNDDVKRLLTFIRSFLTNLSSYINEREKEILTEKEGIIELEEEDFNGRPIPKYTKPKSAVIHSPSYKE